MTKSLANVHQSGTSSIQAVYLGLGDLPQQGGMSLEEALLTFATRLARLHSPELTIIPAGLANDEQFGVLTISHENNHYPNNRRSRRCLCLATIVRM